MSFSNAQKLEKVLEINIQSEIASRDNKKIILDNYINTLKN